MAIYPLLLFGICVGGFPFCCNAFVSAFPFTLPFAPTENTKNNKKTTGWKNSNSSRICLIYSFLINKSFHFFLLLWVVCCAKLHYEHYHRIAVVYNGNKLWADQVATNRKFQLNTKDRRRRISLQRKTILRDVLNGMELV